MMLSRNIPLQDLLNEIYRSELTLPDFQREFQWKTDRMRDLLTSMLLKYPIGALLIGKDAKVGEYSVKRPMFLKDNQYQASIGAKKPDDTVRLILDGQQRLTSIGLLFTKYFSFSASDLLNKSEIRKRWFLKLDLLGLKELDFDEKTILSTNYDTAKQSIMMAKYLLTKPQENTLEINGNAYSYDNSASSTDLITHFGKDGWLPLDLIFTCGKNGFQVNTTLLSKLQLLVEPHLIERSTPYAEYTKHLNRPFDHKNNPEDKKQWEAWHDLLEAWTNAVVSYLQKSVLGLNIPVYEIDSDDFDRVVGIFSVINISGLELNNFDLLISRSASKNWNLRSKVEDFLIKKPYADTHLQKLSGNQNSTTWRTEVELLTWFKDVSCRDSQGQLKPFKRNNSLPKFLTSELPKIIKFTDLISKVLGESWHEQRGLEKLTYAKALQYLKKMNDSDWDYNSKIYTQLNREQVQKHLDVALKLFARGVLALQYILGVRSDKNLSYSVMFLPLALSLTDDVWEDLCKDPKGACSLRLQKWFWHSIFGGAYQGSTKKERALPDIGRLLFYLTQGCDNKGDWIYEGETSINMSKNTSSSRFDQIIQDQGAPGHGDKDSMTLGNSDSNSTLKNMLLAYVLSQKPNDITPNGKSLNPLRASDDTQALDAEHLMSLETYNKRSKQEIERNAPHPINSPMNFTYLTKKSNGSFQSLGLYDKLDGAQVQSLLDPTMTPHLLHDPSYSTPQDFIQNLKSFNDVEKELEYLLTLRHGNLMKRLAAIDPHSVSKDQW